MQVVWAGVAPPRSLVRAIEARGVRLVRTGRVRVVATAGGRRAPGAPEGSAEWLWVAGGAALAPEAVRRAVLDGAYDAVALGAPGAAERIAARLVELATPEPATPETSAFVARSAAGRQVLAQLARAARTSMAVLLTGETGTGKDVCARLLHEWSPRNPQSFVAINCAAIPNELIESELFGHVRGAFSGAVRDYPGQIAEAEGGTVFLDEIDDTPKSLQMKLLRVLEDRVISRLGENSWRQVDFRLVAATNRDLRRLVAAGEFGADLYERLAIVTIVLPPLRDRIDDLEPLVHHFLARHADLDPAARLRPRVDRVAPEALEALVAYPWPGNVRELRNVVAQALVRKRAGTELLLSDLPPRILGVPEPLAGDRDPAERAVTDPAAIGAAIAGGRFRLRAEVETLERTALQIALDRTGGSAAAAARLLGEVGRGTAADPGGTVRAMMRRLGVKAP